MSWTDERIESLRTMWEKGLTASQIADELGGVSRNAVIGKVHRLGLSGRATPSRPVKRPPRLARPKPRFLADGTAQRPRASAGRGGALLHFHRFQQLRPPRSLRPDHR